MQNPWVHDDDEVSTEAEQVHQSRVKTLATLMWAVLLVLFVAIFVLSDGQLSISGPGEAISMLLYVFGMVLVALFAFPVLFKLLRISRLLTTLVVLGSLGVGGWFLVRNGNLFAAELQVLTDQTTGGVQELMELVEALSALV